MGNQAAACSWCCAVVVPVGDHAAAAVAAAAAAAAVAIAVLAGEVEQLVVACGVDAELRARASMLAWSMPSLIMLLSCL